MGSRVCGVHCAPAVLGRHHRAIAAAMTAEPPAPMATNVHPYRIVDTLISSARNHRQDCSAQHGALVVGRCLVNAIIVLIPRSQLQCLVLPGGRLTSTGRHAVTALALAVQVQTPCPSAGCSGCWTVSSTADATTVWPRATTRTSPLSGTTRRHWSGPVLRRRRLLHRHRSHRPLRRGPVVARRRSARPLRCHA